MDLRDALKSAFGFDEFRPYQESIIARVVDGQDTLGVLPTGAGKSLCYQLPALLLTRPTLVISPLIALMKDQVDNLPQALHPRAAVINSAVDADELDRRLEGIEQGSYRLIYAAPERLRQQRFLTLLQRTGLSLVVVDEAHCVSVWGHDFRPDYLFIRKALESLSQALHAPPTVLALTATATPEMQQEIAGQLGRPLGVVEAPMYRANLRLEVLPCRNTDDKAHGLIQVCQETPGATIVYANSRDRCESLAGVLNGHGLPSAYYHAGLEPYERRTTQERFMLGRVRIIVATVAFGMGVDKQNVRLVAHYSLPESIESYAQEAGRAGRDGRPSRCVVLYAAGDKSNLTRWKHQQEVKLEHVKAVYQALKGRLGTRAGMVLPEELREESIGDGPEADVKLRVAVSILERAGLLRRHPDAGRNMLIEMVPALAGARAKIDGLIETRRNHADRRIAEIVGYAEGAECRHVVISRHFGQELDPCGAACDLCLGTATVRPVSAVARTTGAPAAMIVPTPCPDPGRAILAAALQCPPATRTAMSQLLAGSEEGYLQRYAPESYGVLAGRTLKGIRGLIDVLIEQGLLELNRERDYPVIRVTAEGRQAFRGEGLIMPFPTPSAQRPTPDAALSGTEMDRFEQLRAWRRIEAQKAGLPPYTIFHDSTLRAIACANPRSIPELAALPGVGPRRIDAFGRALLELLHGPPGE